ncbi:helix-turn-helix transcriptional regulator [Neisseriaceae bacterium CLB008]
MKNVLMKHNEKKRPEILLHTTNGKHDSIAITDGIRIERTIINKAGEYQQPMLRQKLYDDHNIYFHFIIDADIHVFNTEGQRIGHLITDKVYQVVGTNSKLTEENQKTREKKLTFVIAMRLLDKWQQDYEIPEWLDYKQSGKDFIRQISLGRYHKRIMLLVQQLLFMDIKTLSDTLSFKSSALSICSSIFQLYSISKNNNFIDDVLCILHKDPLTKWHLPTLAKQVGTNECYLKQEFKTKTGISIGRYIKNLRMQEALELIINHQLSTKEAAYKIGYADVGYFSRIFKQQYGYTPSDLVLK